jgi:hypothetical protein
VDVHFSPSKAKATVLLRDLKAAAFPLHHVVITDDAFMDQAADAFEMLGSGQAVSVSRGDLPNRRL